MKLNLEGKGVIITGGVQGVGKAMTQAFAEEGAKVVVFDIEPENSFLLKELKESVKKFKGVFYYRKADVTQMEEVQKAVEETIKNIGRIDILVNNVGGGHLPIPLEDLEENIWDLAINLNLKATYVCSRVVIKYMKLQRSGKIINISSTGGRGPSARAYLPYVAAKAGVLGFTRQLAFEVGSFGINVNAIAPGIMIVGRGINRLENISEEDKNRMLDSIPLRRLGRLEEVAYAALFLASEKSDYITGATIDVNGGRVMM